MKSWNFKGFPKGNTLQLRHGMTGTRTHFAWIEMRRRCRKPHDATENARYKGRGITVCDRWQSFENFLSDMGKCPEGMEIDRKDVNGNYEPCNCRWATELQQQNNRRSNVFINIGGINKTISEWARENGVRPRTAAQRIRAGWPPEIAVKRESDRGRKLCA